MRSPSVGSSRMEKHWTNCSLLTHATVRQCTRTTAIAVGLTLSGRQRLRDGVPQEAGLTEPAAPFSAFFRWTRSLAAMQKIVKLELSSGIREIALDTQGSTLFDLFLSRHHVRFNRLRRAEPVSTKLLHGFWEVDVTPYGCLQKNSERACYRDMPSFSRPSVSPLFDQKKVSMNLKGKANRLALSCSKFQRKTRI